MKSATALRQARRRAGFSQRQLAQLAGVSQPSIARIESGKVVPRIDTLDKLLRYCGAMLDSLPIEGAGVDRTLAYETLRLDPATRLKRATSASDGFARLLSITHR